MRILSITAQKPHSTGSGIYLTELVKGLAGLGHEQAVVAGVYKEDVVNFPEGTAFYPVVFKTEQLPFFIPGMSDEMPYENTVYGEMTETMLAQFTDIFGKEIRRVVEFFDPDMILCHHLYILTANVRLWCPGQRIIGICHGTDVRQMQKIPLYRQLIREQIQKLDGILALQENQVQEIKKIYGVQSKNIEVIGVGYNQAVFYDQKREKKPAPIRITFAGKISEKKGVHCLIRAVSRLRYPTDRIRLSLAGGYSNEQEYKRIVELAQECPYPVEFLGMLPQTELAELLNQSHLFVLPSFYEGLPLVLLEARACGAKVICTNLPGVKAWLDHNLKNHGISFVEPPIMKNIDETGGKSAALFEERLKNAMEQKISEPYTEAENIERLSWRGVCARLDCIIEKTNTQ